MFTCCWFHVKLTSVRQFEQLDPGLQEAFEKYLAERGVNETLAMFIPEYAEYKEQKVRQNISLRPIVAQASSPM